MILNFKSIIIIIIIIIAYFSHTFEMIVFTEVQVTASRFRSAGFFYAFRLKLTLLGLGGIGSSSELLCSIQPLDTDKQRRSCIYKNTTLYLYSSTVTQVQSRRAFRERERERERELAYTKELSVAGGQWEMTAKIVDFILS